MPKTLLETAIKTDTDHIMDSMRYAMASVLGTTPRKPPTPAERVLGIISAFHYDVGRVIGMVWSATIGSFITGIKEGLD